MWGIHGKEKKECSLTFSQIEYGGNEGKLSIGEAYMEVARYLTEGWNFNQRLENSKPVTQDE